MANEYECPDCGEVGQHNHPTGGVLSCDNCAYCAGGANFRLVRATHD